MDGIIVIPELVGKGFSATFGKPKKKKNIIVVYTHYILLWSAEESSSPMPPCEMNIIFASAFKRMDASGIEGIQAHGKPSTMIDPSL